MQRRFLFAILAAAISCVAIAGEPAFYATPFARTPSAAELEALGRDMFFDETLSASGTVSCATCHDPARAYGASSRSRTASRGFRAIPSLRYQQSVPPFTEHMHDSDGDDGVDQGPAGGRTWDGRAQSAHEQAALPLLSPTEMGNANVEAVAAKLRDAKYAPRMRAAFGEGAIDDPRAAFRALVWSLEVFQQNAAEFYPYDSKYDAYLRGQVELSVRERRGLDLFNDPQKGNCASCHPSGLKNGAHPAFTDYGFIALAVPRNRALPANRDAAFFDLGLCGPLRTDLRDRPEYCGLFRTPTLRNVALRTAFFHNGRFTTLREVLDFYAERETSPRKWYPASGYDDLPPRYAGNVEREPPFDRGKGAMPRLTKSERADIVAFLQTLTDGYSGHIAHERSQ